MLYENPPFVMNWYGTNWVERMKNVFYGKDYSALMEIGEIMRTREEDILNMSS